MDKKKIMVPIIMLIIALSGCTGPTNGGKSLYEHGMDVLMLMDEMVSSSSYGSLMSSSEEIEQMRLMLAAGDYAAPQAVYEIEVLSFRDILALAESEDITEPFSDSLQNMLDNRSAASLVSLVNSRNGAAALASASVYTAGKTFVSSDTAESTLYLYTFRNGNPIAVAFTVGEDNTVTATGAFLMIDGFDAKSAEQLQDLLREAGFPGAVRLLPDVP